MSKQHLFQKGVSGNPSGLPKAYREIQKLARSYSVEAIERLAEHMRDRKNKKISLQATQIMLERGWGKVAQAITGEAGEGPIKFEVSWKNSEVATIDITPDVPLLGVDDGE